MTTDWPSVCYTVASIIVIYQMFLLQAWTAKVDASRNSLDDAKLLDPRDMKRKTARRDAQSFLRDFPLAPSLVLLVVILVLVSSAVYASLSSGDDSFLIAIPALSLAGASAFSLAYSRRKWGGILEEFVKSL
jgi:hypothetical protein